MTWGTCGGIAKHYDMDLTIVRIIAVLTLFLWGVGFWLYLILRFVIPLEP